MIFFLECSVSDVVKRLNQNALKPLDLLIQIILLRTIRTWKCSFIDGRFVPSPNFDFVSYNTILKDKFLKLRSISSPQSARLSLFLKPESTEIRNDWLKYAEFSPTTYNLYKHTVNQVPVTEDEFDLNINREYSAFYFSSEKCTRNPSVLLADSNARLARRHPKYTHYVACPGLLADEAERVNLF